MTRKTPDKVDESYHVPALQHAAEIVTMCDDDPAQMATVSLHATVADNRCSLTRQ